MLRARANCSRLSRRDRLLFAVRLLLAGLSTLADVDTALEVGTIFDGDTGRNYVAGEGAVAANVDSIAGRQVAAHFAENDDLAGIDVGRDYAIPPDGHAVAG